MAWCHQAWSHYWTNIDPYLYHHMASLGHNDYQSMIQSKVPLNLIHKLKYWSWDKMDISHTTFSNIFSSMQMCKFRLKFHCSLFPRVQSLVQIMACHPPSNKLLSEPMMHKCVTRPQWVKQPRLIFNKLYYLTIFKYPLWSGLYWVSNMYEC